MYMLVLLLTLAVAGTEPIPLSSLDSQRDAVGSLDDELLLHMSSVVDETTAAVSLLQTTAVLHHSVRSASTAVALLNDTGVDSTNQSPASKIFVMPWVVPANDPRDWLFHVHTLECRPEVVFDNEQTTYTSRIFIPSLILFCVCLLVQLGVASRRGLYVKGRDSSAPPEVPGAGSEGHSPGHSADSASIPEEKQQPAIGKPERLWHLDFARTVAIVCVIFEHSGGMGYTRRNAGFGEWWALPYLYMTSGMAIMMSKSSMCGYILRLSAVFAVGVSANWTADVITHRDWQHDFANTIFQMIFVLMLIGMALLTEPLRQSLLWRQQNPCGKASLSKIMWTAFWGILVAVGLFRFVRAEALFKFQLSGDFGSYYISLTEHLPLFLIEFCGTLFLCHLATILQISQHRGLVGWILLSFIYLPSIIVPWHQDQFARLLSLYIFAMVTMAWPLKGQETLSRCVSSYWPFLIMFLVLLSMPDMVGRCDMFPPGTYWERIRHRSGECILTICFVTASFKCTDPYNIMAWLGWWSLFAYCFHVAFYRIMGSPYGAVTTFLFVPVFGLINMMCSKGRSSENASRSDSQ